MKRRSQPIKVGLLGGGQLARMLALKAHEMGLQPHVLSPSAKDPAAQVTAHWHQGNHENLKDLTEFLAKVDVTTFESEFCDPELLKKASLAQNSKILPRPALIKSLQDRWSQKKLLDKHGLKTARFFKIDSFKQAKEALAQLSGKMVLKKRRFGYDGYGTFVIKSYSDLEDIKSEFKKKTEGWIGEAFIPFNQELALIGFRNKSGDFAHLPLCQTHQENSRCLWVKGPAKHTKAQSFIKKFHKFMDEIKYQGALAVELFDFKGELWVNELAPRVHNSGHASLDALTDDQFSLHLKSILNCHLTSPSLTSQGFAMLNLLGQSNQTPKWNCKGNYKLHWYEKLENRPGRKMGHINAVASSPKKALDQVLRAKKEFHL